MKQLNREEIVASLLKHLPDISKSLNEFVGYLQKVIDDENNFSNEIIVDSIIIDLGNLVQSILELVKEVNLKTTNTEGIDDFYALYCKSLGNVAIGLKEILVWLKEGEAPEDKLTKAVDLLFLGGQQLIELVEKITEN
ncbi:MAG: hypothetical protein VR72_12505 [Clostridiaceae bacterium BRH_c20a]|nr:MAG: hypothetical protein VR72_12505 [Clostridiaceae bacterium BRH_c20a]